MYRDPLPHPALREGRISRLISLANRAMAIAQLTQLRIAIPSSGNVPGEVPIDCFPMTDDMDKTKVTKRVSFATGGQMSTVPIEPPIVEAEEPSTEEARVKDSRDVSPVPPPGFRPFEWPQAEWIKNGDVNRDPGLKFVASWSAKIAEEMPSPPSSGTIVTDTDRELSGFHDGFRSVYPYCTRPDPFSASASVTPTDEDTFHI